MSEENTNKDLNNNVKSDMVKSPVKAKLAPKKRRNRVRDGRVPLHKQKKVEIEQEPGFVYRVVVDYGSSGERLRKFAKAGWIHINKYGKTVDAAQASQEGALATVSVGGGDMGYYMRIPEQYYIEDQEDKQSRNDILMGQIGLLKSVPKDQQRGTVKIDYS
jgi:hypothetical protein